MTFTEDLALMMRDTGLGVEELLHLASIYSEITINTDQLVRLACAHRVTIAEVYWECRKAQSQIASRVQQLKRRETNR